MTTANTIRYLTQAEATQIDQELFNDYQFSVDQLMELAGLACAQAVASVYTNRSNKVLVICGPGNNGGDGLVCARHLSMFGYTPTVHMARAANTDLMRRLVHQVQSMQINVINELPPSTLDTYGVIVDALFGFSFRPPVRQPYDTILRALTRTSTPIASVDIPSGWHVEDGPPEPPIDSIQPAMLISLTAPKQCARDFHGAHHFLAGRFVPVTMQHKYNLNLPDYPGTDGILKLPPSVINPIICPVLK